MVSFRLQYYFKGSGPLYKMNYELFIFNCEKQLINNNIDTVYINQYPV